MSSEDGCYVGSAPPLIGQSCHGKTEAAVIAQLSQIVEEWVATLLVDGKPLPAPLAEKKLQRSIRCARLTRPAQKRRRSRPSPATKA